MRLALLYAIVAMALADDPLRLSSRPVRQKRCGHCGVAQAGAEHHHQRRNRQQQRIDCQRRHKNQPLGKRRIGCTAALRH